MAEGGEESPESGNDDEIICELCYVDISDTESFKCFECDMMFCIRCTKCHLRIPVTSRHCLLSRTEVEEAISKVVPRMCIVHTTMEITHYCYSCNVLICVKCIRVSHYRHKGVSLKELADRKRKIIREKIIQAKEETFPGIEKTLKVLERMKMMNQCCWTEEKQKLYERKLKIMSKIDKLNNSMASKIIEQHQKNGDQLDKMSTKRKMTPQEYREIWRHGSDIQVIKAEEQFSNYFAKLQKGELYDSDEGDSDVDLATLNSETLRKLLGSLQMQTKSEPATFVPGDDHDEPVRKVFGSIQITTKSEPATFVPGDDDDDDDDDVALRKMFGSIQMPTKSEPATFVPGDDDPERLQKLFGTLEMPATSGPATFVPGDSDSDAIRKLFGTLQMPTATSPATFVPGDDDPDAIRKLFGTIHTLPSSQDK